MQRDNTLSMLYSMIVYMYIYSLYIHPHPHVYRFILYMYVSYTNMTYKYLWTDITLSVLLKGKEKTLSLYENFCNVKSDSS